jgi:hypothetical protein
MPGLRPLPRPSAPYRRAPVGMPVAIGVRLQGIPSAPRLAMPAGGEVSVGVVRQGMVQLHVPGEQLPDGTPVTRGNYELRMRHGIVVNRQGQRFGNESFFQALGAQLWT